MNTQEKCICLTKFQDQQYIEPFYERGQIYMNTRSFFQQIEDHNLRGDKYENLTSLLQPDKVKVFIGGRQLHDFAGPISIYNPPDDPDGFTHVFSMVSLCNGDVIREDNKIFDDMVQKFGDTLVSIFDLKTFFERLIAKLQAMANDKIISNYRAGRVLYFNKDIHHGKITTFHKSDQYDWQQEWRLAIATRDFNTPFQFEIGSMDDISKKMKVKDFKNQVSITGEKQEVNF